MPFRIAAVSFLNTIPLIEMFASSPEHGVEVVTDLPSRLAARLEGGEVDAALLPVADILAGSGDGILGTAGIACRGAVESVKLFANEAPQDLARVLTDRGSRSSVLLLRILLAARGARPEFTEVEPDPQRLPAAGEGTLVIGDRCFAFERVWRERRPDRPGWDLGAAWRELTGLPFVFAAWAAAPGLVSRVGRDGVARLAGLLDASRDHGLARRGEIAVRAAARGRLGIGGSAATEAVKSYLEDSLRYVLGPEELDGIRRFRALGRSEGAFADGPELVIHQG